MNIIDEFEEKLNVSLEGLSGGFQAGTNSNTLGKESDDVVEIVGMGPHDGSGPNPDCPLKTTESEVPVELPVTDPVVVEEEVTEEAGCSKNKKVTKVSQVSQESLEDLNMEIDSENDETVDEEESMIDEALESVETEEIKEEGEK